MEKRAVVRALFSTFILTLLVAGTVYMVFALQTPTTLSEETIALFMDHNQGSLKPEPGEHRAYHLTLILIALFGLLTVLTWSMAEKLVDTKLRRAGAAVFMTAIIVVCNSIT